MKLSRIEVLPLAKSVPPNFTRGADSGVGMTVPPRRSLCDAKHPVDIVNA
jgi:hypothetical protein